jgi:hypothetical protein
MTDQSERFACMLDPLGLWVVWDQLRREPAEAPGFCMVGLSEADARLRCGFLNSQLLRVVSSGEQHPPFGTRGEDAARRADRLKLR